MKLHNWAQWQHQAPTSPPWAAQSAAGVQRAATNAGLSERQQFRSAGLLLLMPDCVAVMQSLVKQLMLMQSMRCFAMRWPHCKSTYASWITTALMGSITALQAAQVPDAEASASAAAQAVQPQSRKSAPHAHSPAQGGRSPLAAVAAVGQTGGRPRTRRSAEQQPVGRQLVSPTVDPDAAVQHADVSSAHAGQAQRAKRQSGSRHRSATAAEPRAETISAAKQGEASLQLPAMALGSDENGTGQRHRLRQSTATDDSPGNGRAAPSSPAVVSDRAARNSPAARTCRAAENSPAIVSSRAAPNSPAVASPAGQQQGRAPQRNRRSSIIGAGGALPFAGHSFMLTAFEDERQKQRMRSTVIRLGGHVLDDIPKPEVLTA